MTTRITREILEGLLACRLKGYLKLNEQPGEISEYESLLLERRTEVKRFAIGKILDRLADGQITRDVMVTTSLLRQGPQFVIDAKLADEPLLILLDGLKRVDGHSKVGDFHYMPMLFHEGQRVGKLQRLLLEFWANRLSRIQGCLASDGNVWLGKECRMVSVRLKPDERGIRQVWNDLKDFETSESQPTLILNRHCPICEFRTKCRSQALHEDNLSLLRSMGEKEIKTCARKGILTLTQLAHTFRPRRRGKRAAPKNKQRHHALQALAIRDKRIYVLGTPPQLPESPVEIYLDMEGKPDEGFVYLIGMIVVDHGSETSHSFWADSKRQETELVERFLAQIAHLDDFRVFSYGGYERAFFRRVGQQLRTPAIDKVLERLTNVLSHVYSHFYFPTYSNGLKDIGAYLGFTWSDPEASGIQSLVWRMKWEKAHDEEWKQRLLRYNFEDCAALKRVVDFVRANPSRTLAGAEATTSLPTPTPVSIADDIGKAAYEWNFGPVTFVHPDFDHINRCAYFDYQRDRVYIRSSPMIKRIKARRTRRRVVRSRRLRLSARVRIEPSQCPRCESTQIAAAPLGKKINCIRPRTKRAFDLLYTSAGIRRRVIECRTSAYECLACGHDFVPEEHERLDKHGHGLKSWAMYLHVAHAISLDRIRQMCDEFFGLRLTTAEVLMLKGLLGQYYRGTTDAIFKKLINGNLLHVDETECRRRFKNVAPGGRKT